MSLRKKVFQRLTAALVTTTLLASSLMVNVFAGGSYDDNEELRAESASIAVELEREGIVLLENNENADGDKVLPLDPGSKVNVFGIGSVDPFIGGGGSGVLIVDDEDVVGFYDVLDDVLDYNQELKEWYEVWYGINEYEDMYLQTSDKSVDGGNIFGFSDATRAEPTFRELTGEDEYWKDVAEDEDGNWYYLDVNKSVRNSSGNKTNQRVADPDPKYQGNYWEKAFEHYDTDEETTAIIVISRSGTESNDLEASELRLRNSEKDLIVNSRKEYDNVIVLFNTCNVMEMGWLNDVTSLLDEEEAEEWPADVSVEIDAAMMIWAPGEVSIEAVAETLVGENNPSGKLVDTIAYSIDDHPAALNFGDHQYSDGTDYVEYREGIYVGYRYFETFAPELVQYHFGYGLSYTTFEWNDFQYDIDIANEKITVNVTVENTGDVAGKDVVQVYISPPYKGTIEKSDFVLVGYAKTGKLDPEQTETVTIEIDFYDFASYDTENQQYILETGEYAVKVMTYVDGSEQTEALKSEQTFELGSPVTYTHDPVTGTKLVNQFEEALGDITVMSRHEDLRESTYPQAPSEVPADPPEAVSRMDEYPEPVTEGEAPDFGKIYKKTILLQDVYNAALDLAGIDNYDDATEEEKTEFEKIFYDAPELDELWDKFLSQVTVNEAYELIADCGYQTRGLERLGIPRTDDKDGPQQVKGAEVTAIFGDQAGMAYPIETAIACTWNDELAEIMGLQVAKDAEEVGVQVWYAPATNTHRTPLGGRNFEYYSEDPFIAGKMTAAVTRGAQSDGLIVTLKHFALNDQETNRNGVTTWSDEQTIREIYLKSFEIGVKEGRAKGMMSSFNRIGQTWAGGHKGLLTNVLREEWGFRGFVVTDYYMFFGVGTYMCPAHAVYAQNDALLVGVGYSLLSGLILPRMRTYYANDPIGFGSAMRNSVKNLCYFKTFTKVFDPDFAPENYQERYSYQEEYQAVDFDSVSGNYSIGYFDDGNDAYLTNLSQALRNRATFNYTVNIPESGEYDISLFMANTKTSNVTVSSYVSMKFDDISVDLSKMVLAPTDGWRYTNPAKVYLEAGTYNVEVKVTNADGLVSYSGVPNFGSFTVSKDMLQAYPVTVAADDTVKVKLSQDTAYAGDEVSFTIEVNNVAKKVDRVTIYNEDETFARVLLAQDGVYTFTMRGEPMVIKVALKDVEGPDTNCLEYIISIADNYALNGDLEELVETARKAFDTAYAEAIEVLERAQKVPAEATQTEVNEAASNLLNTFKYLTMKADKEMLRMLIALADAILEDSDAYIPNSIKGLESLVQDAKVVEQDGDALAKEISQMVIRLIDEIDKARLRPDKSALEDLVQQMSLLDSKSYTVESFAVLVKALEEGNSTLLDDNADADEVNAAVQAIEMAYAGLMKINDPGPNDTDEPDDTNDPKDTDEPDDTKGPQDTNGPNDTDEPDDTKDPKDTDEPDDTKDPKDTEDPDDTKDPRDTSDPKDTKDPRDTEQTDGSGKKGSGQTEGTGGKTSGKNSVKTGDTAAISIIVTILLLSGCVLGGVLVYRRKRQ